MAKKKKKSARRDEDGDASPSRFGLSSETMYAVYAVIFFVLGIFFVLAAYGYGGVVGNRIYGFLGKLLGIGYYLLPTLMILLAYSYWNSVKANVALVNIFGSLLFCTTGLGIIELFAPGRAGLLGNWIAHPLSRFFDTPGAAVLLAALFCISLLLLFNTHPLATLRAWQEKRRERLENAEEDEEMSEELTEDEEERIDSALPAAGAVNDSDEDARSVAEPAEPTIKESIFGKKKRADVFSLAAYTGEYTPPPLSIFAKDSGKPGVGDIKANANIIKRTLQNFGIDVAMDEIAIGPSVTRYAMKPAEGVRISKILGLQRNLELALAAHPVRIEAPIPGKALVGIEVPNSAKTTLGLGTLLSFPEYQESSNPLMLTLGRDVDGQPLFANLVKMPHLLIAGATGSGKSVTIHTLINSLLFRNSPEMLRFVLVDPKRVELTLYNGIPHLLTPVITDSKKAILALKWLVSEMERRYAILEEKRVRDITSYHATIVGPAREKAKGGPIDENEDVPETMPYIILVIDELADIMSTYPRELEAGIVRLAQMSRAVGIHLILSTQRPSVNVITGLIKANIPGRVALQVSSQIDSRTILDASGAEKLLGAGDMLFLAGDMGKPKRLQSAYISEDEVKKVTDFLREHKGDDEDLSMTIDLDAAKGSGNGSSWGDDEDEIDDELFEEARETVVHAGKASTSYLQRKLRIGYSRAARLMDVLEERGVIGPADGSKPRDILVARPDAAGTASEEEV